MALVIFFVPEPAKGVAEMARVVRPGGTVAAYAWDMAGGGFPFAPINAELRQWGMQPLSPPSADASRVEVLRTLWAGAGLESVETMEISPRRVFANFDEFWTVSTGAGSVRPMLNALTPADIEKFKQGVQARLQADEQGRIVHTARANAIKGRVAG
jgi:hypothetical protein